MNNLEQEYFKYCIYLIEEKLSWLNSTEWKQREYLNLIDILEKKTGTTISLSTVKRIWNPTYNGIPNPSTLESFALFLGYENWLDFKEKNNKKIGVKKKTFLKKRIQSSLIKSRKRHLKLAAFISVICLCFILLFKLINNNQNDITYKEDILFSCEKSTHDKIPNSVIFSYDVKGIKAEKFFIQQDWDKARRVEVSQENSTLTDIYYTPGYFNAKLFADDKNIKVIPVHITYNNWFIGARQHPTKIIPFQQDSWVADSYLGVKNSAIKESNLDINKKFQFNIYNTREFNVDGDNFTYSSSLKMERLKTFTCPSVALLIKGEHNLFWLSFCIKGCESNLNLRCSDFNFSGKTNDLSSFGVDIYTWQNVKINVDKKNMQLSINDSLIFECHYMKSIGSLKTINYYFNGIGQIDNVQLLDSEGKVQFADDFND